MLRLRQAGAIYDTPYDSSWAIAPPICSAVVNDQPKRPLSSAFDFVPNRGHKAGMAKIRVTFKPVRVAEGDWHILAVCPGAEPIPITGFKSKAEIDEWLNGDRRIAWLRSQGYAK